MRSTPVGRSDLTLVMADQALLSGLTLLMQMVLIHGSSKSEYAAFAIIMSIILLTQGIQNAAICTPLLVLGQRWQAVDVPRFEHYLERMNDRGTTISAVLCGLVALVAVNHEVRHGIGLSLATGMAAWGVWRREYRRTIQLRDHRLETLLRTDGLVVIVVASCLLLLLLVRSPIAAFVVLGLFGAGNVMASRSSAREKEVHERPSAQVVTDWRNSIKMTTIGSAVSWLQTASYPLLVAGAIGSHAAADVAAGRLFLSPGLLLGTAWGRLAIVGAAEALRDGGPTCWRRFVMGEMPRVGAGTAAYVGITALVVVFGGGRILGSEYSNNAIIWSWLAVGVLTMLRSVASIGLQGAAAFTHLTKWSAIAACTSCVFVVILALWFGQVGAVLGLAAGELVSGVAFFSLVRFWTPDRSSGGAGRF